MYSPGNPMMRLMKRGSGSRGERKTPVASAGTADGSGGVVLPAADEAELDRDAQEAESPPQRVLQEAGVAEVDQRRIVHLELEGRRRRARLRGEIQLQRTARPRRGRVLIGGLLQHPVELRGRHAPHTLFLDLERQRQNLAGALPGEGRDEQQRGAGAERAG